jgi:hypothetical protein
LFTILNSSLLTLLHCPNISAKRGLEESNALHGNCPCAPQRIQFGKEEKKVTKDLTAQLICVVVSSLRSRHLSPAHPPPPVKFPAKWRLRRLACCTTSGCAPTQRQTANSTLRTPNASDPSGASSSGRVSLTGSLSLSHRHSSSLLAFVQSKLTEAFTFEKLVEANSRKVHFLRSKHAKSI